LQAGEQLLGQLRQLALPHQKARAADIVTASIGVAVSLPASTGDPLALLADADVALYAAQAAGRRPVDVAIDTVEGETLNARITDFGQHRGVVLAIPASEVEHYQEVEHALDLHDIPPAPEPVTFETPLDRLPGFVFDTETTGLDVQRDVVVSVGAVRTHGAKVYPGLTMDRLVNPGRPIPARSTAVHGITNAMVSDAPPIRDVLPAIREMMRDCVLIGHNTGFDISMLRRAMEAEGQAWHDPPWLDVLLLAAAMDTDETDFNLESMALRMGVNVSGRHTALGDSLVTAEVFVRMLPALAKAGVKTFGDAIEYSQRATRVIAKQREAGW
ncbi:MAG: diguanylate cyclase, partial [Alphaproteobacteria bacterium]|nr:diguanylate cyclase [Alphaproteobacteria bacterium]